MNGEDSIKAVHDGQVELSFNGNKKFETIGYGVTVVGAMQVSGITTIHNGFSVAGLSTLGTGGSGQVVTSIETAMPGSPTDAQLITAQGVKEFIDGLDLGVAGDSGSIAIDIFSGGASSEETLTIAGTANEIETSASGNTVP